MSKDVYIRRARMGDLIPEKVFFHVCKPIQKVSKYRITSYPYFYGEGWSYKVDYDILNEDGSVRRKDSGFLSDLGIDTRHNGGNALFETHDDALVYAAS